MARLSRAVAVAATMCVPSSILFGCGGGGDEPDNGGGADTSETTTVAPLSTTQAPSSTTQTTTATPSEDTCEPVMLGTDCLGGDVGELYEMEDAADCCTACAANPKCAAYTHVAQENACYLKDWCNYLVQNEDLRSMNVSSSMLNKLPQRPEPTCANPDLGKGFVCEGNDLDNQPADSADKCCDICMDTKNCLVYSWSAPDQTCYLKSKCPLKPRNANFTTGWVPPKNRASAARYQVGRGYYEIPGYQCGGGNGSTVVFYPRGEGPFNVVVYGHGAWGYVDGSDDWLETVASMGLIVVAPFQGKDPHPCKSKFADDLLNALSGSREGGAALHPALATADWSRTGIFGHSKGAKYATLAASKGKLTHNVTAMMASCDTPKDQPENTVASMFTTGTLDKYNKNDSMLEYFEAFEGKPKVYLNLQDAYHMEVQEGMRLNVLSAQFLSCHVANNEDDCEVIYGDGQDSVCNVNDYHHCMVTPADGTRNLVV